MPQEFAHLQSYGATYESVDTVGYVPQDSIFPSRGVTDSYYFEAGSKPVVAISCISGIGAMFVLGRAWGPEMFLLACAMVLLTMFGALILSKSRMKCQETTKMLYLSA